MFLPRSRFSCAEVKSLKKILERQLSTRFTIQNEYRVDFWEIVPHSRSWSTAVSSLRTHFSKGSHLSDLLCKNEYRADFWGIVPYRRLLSAVCTRTGLLPWRLSGCSVLQCVAVAVCYSVLQCVAVSWNLCTNKIAPVQKPVTSVRLQCVAVGCSVLQLQCVIVCCSVLQCLEVCARTRLLLWRLSGGCGAVCCSVLQRVAVWCSALQRVAACCSVLQCVAVCCSVLQCVAVCCGVLRCFKMCAQTGLLSWHLWGRVCCSVLQCVAVCCSVLQCVAVSCSVQIYSHLLEKLFANICMCVEVCCSLCCSVLQCVAVCCSVIKNIALCCSVLRCVAVFNFIFIFWRSSSQTSACVSRSVAVC